LHEKRYVSGKKECLYGRETKNIFVSHQHNDADKIESLFLIGRHGRHSYLRKKLKNNATNEQYIKQELIKP
jgi:hypothetical protein